MGARKQVLLSGQKVSLAFWPPGCTHRHVCMHAQPEDMYKTRFTQGLNERRKRCRMQTMGGRRRRRRKEAAAVCSCSLIQAFHDVIVNMIQRWLHVCVFQASCVYISGSSSFNPFTLCLLSLARECTRISTRAGINHVRSTCTATQIHGVCRIPHLYTSSENGLVHKHEGRQSNTAAHRIFDALGNSSHEAAAPVTIRRRLRINVPGLGLKVGCGRHEGTCSCSACAC